MPVFIDIIGDSWRISLCAWRGSNAQPSAPEADALSI